MRELIDFPGGRNLVNDDLEAIQLNFGYLVNLYRNAGPFIVHGCEFTLQSGSLYQMSDGVVFINNRLMPVVGGLLNMDTAKCISGKAPVDLAPREYTLQGVTKSGLREYLTEIRAATSPLAGDNIYLTAAGDFPPQARRLKHAIQEMVYVPGMIIPVNLQIDTSFTNQTPPRGRGEWLGWELRTATQAGGGVGLKNMGLIGAGGGYNPADTLLFDGSDQPSQQTQEFYAVHFVEFVGTRALFTVTI